MKDVNRMTLKDMNEPRLRERTFGRLMSISH